MDKKKIHLRLVDTAEMQRLATLNGYEGYGLNPGYAITDSPEYGSWNGFLSDLVPDMDKRGSDFVTLLWVPSGPIKQAREAFEQRSTDPALYRELLKNANISKFMIVEYTPRNAEHARGWERARFHDRLTFKLDSNGIIYCTKAVLALNNIGKYTYDSEPFPSGRLAAAYYFRQR